jgi:hypothetical protein
LEQADEDLLHAPGVDLRPLFMAAKMTNPQKTEK